MPSKPARAQTENEVSGILQRCAREIDEALEVMPRDRGAEQIRGYMLSSATLARFAATLVIHHIGQ